MAKDDLENDVYCQNEDFMTYLMRLDAPDRAGEVEVQVELVNILLFVFLRRRLLVARLRLLFFLLEGSLGHRRVEAHVVILTPTRAV